ncbi:unnamed protein product [Closterium sp. NIES-53]
MEAEGSALSGPSGSGGVRGAGEAGRGVAGGSAPIASFSTPAKDDVKAFNLQKFSGKDWASWSFRIELLFNHYGLLDVMDGELKRSANEGATKEWDRRSKDGFFLLSQCLSSNQPHHVKHLIKDIQCGPKAWKILKDVHAPSSEAMVVVLERQLHAVKINEGDAVQGAFDQLRDLYVKLSAAGVDYPEKINCYKALSLLPELWGPLVVNLNGMKDSWSLEWIRAQVLQEEFRRKELTAAAGEDGGSAYSMKGFKGRGSKKGKAKEGSGGEQYLGGKPCNKGGKWCGGKCWYCHVEGHPWFKCRKLPGGWRPGQPSIEGSKGVHGAMGEGMGSEEGDGGAGGHGGMFYHVASKVALHRSSHWVIDTGAFMTMTNGEDLLDKVRPSKAATVVSATGPVVPVHGEGRAMFMGADWRLVGLKHVLLVPGLCANLLSTKALSEAGMKMEMMGTKVFKATLDGRVLWDLRGGKDMHRSMWEIPVLPWKEAAARLAAEAVRGGHTSHVTSGGGGDGSDGGLLVHGGGALPSVTPSTGETDWLTAHRRFGHVALPQLQQLFKEERVKGLRIKGEPKEVGSCETCLTSKFSRFPFHSAVWAVHLGLARGSKGWLMWDPKSNTIFTTRDVKFMEGLMFKKWSERGRSKVTIPLGIEVGTNDPLLIPIELSSSSELTEVSHDLGDAEGEAADVEEVLQQGEAPVAERCDTEEEVQQPTPSPKLPPRRTTQGKRDAVRGGAKEGAAKERPKRSAHPRDFLKKALDCTWVLRVKTDAEGRLERRKTRLVIKGFRQREGIDFQEVFAPVAKIYMKQPEGNDDGSGRVCRLNKAIYGLKQAPRCWYARLVEALEALGFKVSGCDESLFMTEGEEEKQFLLVYVDDILLFSPSLERIKEVQGKLKETFQCKALGLVGYYLGLHVERDEVK